MLILLDRDETFIASLKHNKIQRKRELNGANNLEFETNREVEFGQRIIFQDKLGIWNEYIIIDYFKTHGEDGVIYEVYNEDSTSELYGFFIEDMKPRNALASKVLGQLLEGTRFEVGYVDDFGKKSFNLYRTNVKAALWKMLEVYQAEIQVRIEVEKNGRIHRYIDLIHSIGRNVGKRFTYKKDIGSIKKTTSTKELVTALYGFGKGEEVVGEDGQPSGGYGRKIDFGEINGGKKYVEDEEARKKYGLGKERVHIFGSVDFDDCEDKEELLKLTKEKLKELSKPKITYELNVEDISRYEGYIGEGVDLGDIVLVKDEMIDTLVETRVIAIKDNPLEEINDSDIVLGNFIKDLSDNMLAYENLKSVFDNQRNRFNDELEKLANGVKSSYMQRILEKFNKELNETGGWVYAEEGEGLLILNAPREGNPTQAINLKGGMIAIANHKNADGSFAYETFGDGNGFTANLIRAGVLRGGKVFFNLEDGTFLIGESKENYSMYWDGNTLHFRNVDIDLSNNYQIQEINNQISNVDKKIDNASSDFSVNIGKLKDDVSASIKRIDGDMAGLDGKIDQTSEDMTNSLTELSTNLDETKSNFAIQIDTVEKKITSVSQDLKIGQGKLESTITGRIDGLVNVVETNKADVEAYKLENAKVVGDIKSEIKQTAGSIESSVASQIKTVNDTINSKDTAVRDYIKTNYSTTLQTDEKIESIVASEVAILDGKITGSSNDLKKYVQTNYSTKAQTDTAISTKVASESKILNDKIDSNDSAVRDYIASNYSTTTQTADMIESKVVTEVEKAKLAFDGDNADLKKYIDTNYSTKTQTAELISSKVSASSKVLMDDIGEKYYTKTQTDSIIKQTANGFESSVTKINNALYGGGNDKDGKYISVSESITSKIRQNSGMIKSEVANLKDYVVQNYSTITQTSNLIENKVSSNDKKIREDIAATYSTIRQTNDMIESKVSPIKTDLSNNYSTKTQTSDLMENKIRPVNSRLSNVESSIRQTKNEISTKITSGDARSIFKQEAGSFTFDASQVNFNSNVNIKGRFDTYGTNKVDGSWVNTKTSLFDGAIKFYNGDSGYTKGSIYGYNGMNICSPDSVFMFVETTYSTPSILMDAETLQIFSPENGKMNVTGKSRFNGEVEVNSSLYCTSLNADRINLDNVEFRKDFNRLWFRYSGYSQAFVIDFSTKETYFA